MIGDQEKRPPSAQAQAAHWLSLRLSGDMTLDDEYHFRAWIDLSDDHREAYRLVDRAWTVSAAIAGDPALSVMHQPAIAKPGVFTRHRRALSMAASLLLVIGLGWTALPYFDVRSGNHAEDAQQQAFRTGTGQRTRVTLPDGSVVTLDAETELRLRSSATERRLDLIQGRAFFRVAHNPNRPFVVYADGKKVRAIGTAFEVSLDRGNMVVTLTEGKVRVEGATTGSDGGADLVPGRQLVVGSDLDWTLRRVDVAKETSWTQGRLIFMHDPLSKAMADVNRYSTRKLVFEGGTVPDRQIVGVFEAGDVEGFVKAIELQGIAHRTTSTSDEILLVGDE